MAGRQQTLQLLSTCADPQRAWLLLEDYFEKLSLSRKDFTAQEWWPRVLAAKGRNRLEELAILFLRANRPLPQELMTYANLDRFAEIEQAEQEQQVLTATENGFGKRTPIAEYTRHGRGTKGMIAIQTSERNGKVVGAVLAALGETSEEIMLISTGGVLIRTRVSDIRVMGRSTQGVTLITLDDGTVLAGLEKVIETEEDDPAAESPVEE